MAAKGLTVKNSNNQMEYLENVLTLVMQRLCIDGLICKLANYIHVFINFKIAYLRAQ